MNYDAFVENKMAKRIVLVFLVCLLAESSTLGQTDLLRQQLEKLDSIATQDVPKNAPGIATAIVENGEVIFEKYAGLADFSDSSSISKDTRFNLASNGKQFTALAILTLIDDGALSLSDDIRKFLPSLYPNIPSDITIENLLNHSSGIRDIYDLWSLQGLTWWEHSFDNQDVLELIERQKDLNFTPDTEYLYSNTNYILLALIIEKVSGKSFTAFTGELFANLNMPNTSFVQDYSKIRGPIARAYFNFDTWTTYQWIWNVAGDGNIFSTLPDQIQWEKIVQGKGTTSVDEGIIRRSQALVNPSTVKQYGYGLEFGKYKGLDYKFHEGATGAWKATVLRFPDSNIAMITLTNTGKSVPSMQTRQMADVVFDLEEDAKYFVTSPEEIGAYVSEDEILGTYSTPDNFTFEFVKEDEKLYLKRIGRSDNELVREADNIFHQKFDPDFKQEFVKNTQGEMEVTAYYTTHSPYTLIREESNWTNYNYPALNGRYKNAETNTSIEIKHSTDKNYQVIIGNQENAGLLITSTKLLVNNYVFEFAKGANLIESMSLDADRIKNIKFVRQE